MGYFKAAFVGTAASFLFTLVLLSTADARANEPAPQPFDIRPQSLAAALSEFARQSHEEILFAPNIVAEKRSGGVRGTMQPLAALKILLNDSGLPFTSTPSGAILIGQAGESPVVSSAEAKDTLQKEGKKNSSGDFRVAQVDQGALGSQAVDSQNLRAKKEEGLAEIVVTAQKREERLIDVPISIVALSSEELQQRQLTSLDDLQFAVPGMAIQADGLGNRIELRGVSNSIGVSPLVGVYIDEASITNNSGTQMNPNTYDLERVEVLRGPQGTLYGDGSAGGTIRFITKSPRLDRFGFTSDVEALFTQDGAPGQRVNTAVNVPLINNELGLRIVATSDREGGWIDQPAAARKDINGQDLTNVRVKGLWLPTPQFTVTAMAEIYRNDRSTGTLDDVRGDFAQVLNQTTTPRVSEDHDLYNLTLTNDFPSVRILNTTTYFKETLEAWNLGYSYPSSPPGGAPSNLLIPYNLDNDHALTEELRLSSIGSGPWQWTVGGFYRHYRSYYNEPSGYYDVLGPPGTPLPASYGSVESDTLFKSWSVFGDISYNLSDRFKLGVGVRSFHEEQDYQQTFDFGGGPTTTEQPGTFHSVDPRFYAQFKLTPNLNIYASAAKGFRSGGFNASPTQPTFAPESVWTYELGTKMSLLEDRLLGDMALFYTDYTNYVVNGVTPTELFGAYVNAGNARIEGIEWNFAWQPAANWTLGVNGDYLDTRFTQINASYTAYAVGDPLDFVPKYQFTAFGRRNFSWSGKQGFMRLDYTRRGLETVRNRTSELFGESDDINLLGYYANLQWNDYLSLNLFAQNLLNDRGFITPEGSGAPMRSRPRTYGLGFDVSF